MMPLAASAAVVGARAPAQVEDLTRKRERNRRLARRRFHQRFAGDVAMDTGRVCRCQALGGLRPMRKTSATVRMLSRSSLSSAALL